MTTILQIAGVILALYLCDAVARIARSLDYRYKYEQELERNQREHDYNKLLSADLSVAQKEIIKLKGDNLALQKLNHHQIRKIEQLQTNP